MNPRTSAILLAGGTGTRMQTNTLKQFLLLVEGSHINIKITVPATLTLANHLIQGLCRTTSN